MNVKSKILLNLVLLGIVDAIIPIPVIGLILIYVVMQKPAWFMDLAEKIYSPSGT